MDDSRDLPTPRDWLPQVVDRLTPRTALALLISLDPSADGQVTEEEAPAAVLCALQAAEDHASGSGLHLAEVALRMQRRQQAEERERLERIAQQPVEVPDFMHGFLLEEE